MNFRIPWPPSVNHYWRYVDHRPKISAEGRGYRRDVAAALLDQTAELGFIAGITRPTLYTSRIRLVIRAYSADARRRDLDNLAKATLDALQAAGLYEDDSQIDELTIQRGPMGKPPYLLITAEPIE